MDVRDSYRTRMQGFGLIELLVAMTVLAILLGVALPSYRNFIAQKHLRMGTEDLTNYIKTAQTYSLNKHSSYYLSFKPGTTWCYGIDDTAACDCSVANSCAVNGIEAVMSSTSYSGQALTLNVTGFSGSATNPYILFDGKRGTVNIAGSASFSLAGLSTTISTNTGGLVTICSNGVSGYTACTGP